MSVTMAIDTDFYWTCKHVNYKLLLWVNYFQVVNDLQAYLVLQAVNLHEAIFPEESGDWFAIEISVGSAILMS